MRRSAQVAAGGVAILVLVLAASGCGVRGQAGTLDSYGPPPPAWQSTYLQPMTDDPTLLPRWRDVADHLYADTFRATFTYPSDTVKLRFTTSGPLRFTVIAPPRTLKPNFCYQMKLWGPLVPWPADPRLTNFANWALGTRGRWSDGLDNLYLKDGELGAHVGETMRGYLYFASLVTATDGSATQTSTVAGSYHVTWKTSQRAPTSLDGPMCACPVAAQPDGGAYERRYPRVVAGVYGEGEPNRPRPGQLVLPAGTYSGVEFMLTEESFHSRRTDGGRWRTVMRAALPEFALP